MKKKQFFLGYGVFYAPHWKMSDWQFGEEAGICDTKEEAMETFNRRTTHCLHRETRRIFESTLLNVGNYDRPQFISARLWLNRHG